ncbi:hypothetical protein VTK73DRAFT_9476 [Phialemonium thermophilum]|uniref:Conidiation-specific protein 8 n=1 Tax=Phialemonium thermophilum TaxID=223376 RepID=A0ABR3Y512_9PEZI
MLSVLSSTYLPRSSHLPSQQGQCEHNFEQPTDYLSDNPPIMSHETNMSNNMRPDRSGSTSSTGSGGTSGRRRSSGLFESLSAQKRKDEPASLARRQSMNEQRPKAGIFGQMWDSFVRGNGQNAKK